MEDNSHILVVDDHKDIRNLVAKYLSKNGYRVSTADGGAMMKKILETSAIDLVVLDLMMPGEDGLVLCRDLRASSELPIIMLTAMGEETDRVVGLEMGADDYLTKPFSIREFIARIKALFRRAHMNTVDDGGKDIIVCGGLEIDREKRKVLVDGKRMDLTPKEFDLLMLLVKNPGKSFTREKLLRLVWGYEFDGYEHTVNSHINRLRSKIETDLSQPVYILTTWGVGYRFNDEV